MSFPSATRLVCMHGVGDAYLTCALARAFEAQRGGGPVRISIKGSQLAIPAMFDLPATAADDAIGAAESNVAFQQSYPNDADPLYVHPSFVRTPTRLDQLTVKPSVSQADMYRAILGLSPWTALAEPSWPAPIHEYVGATLLIPRARSWPNAHPAFWLTVIERLRARGELVIVADELGTLDRVLAVAAAAKRVIGAQCGVISIINERLRCPKTFAVTELTGPLLFGLTATLPYGDQETFAGTNRPETKVVVVPSNWEAAVAAVAD